MNEFNIFSSSADPHLVYIVQTPLSLVAYDNIQQQFREDLWKEVHYTL